MSSRTPVECVEVAVDASKDPDEREGAIHDLEMANECDELADLAVNEDLADRYRRLALRAIGTPQCDTTLQRLVEEESLEPPLREEAAELLQEREVE